MKSVAVLALLTIPLAPAMVPTMALAQAAVQSDTPVPGRSTGPADASLPHDAGAARDAGLPNAVTGPGAPGTTGTGAAGTGPTGTMAAPGR